MTKEKKCVKIPEGTCCAYCCGDCGWADPMRETAVVRYGAQETELITIHQKALRAATVTLQESS